MYLSHVSLTPSAISKRGTQAAFARGAYGHHQLLCRLFDGARRGSFLFRHLDEDDGLHFLTLSASSPHPANSEDWVVSSKPFHPILHEGQRLVFSVRINPTVSRSPGRSGAPGSSPARGKRRDLIFEAVRDFRRSGSGTPDRRVIAQSCGERWLGERLAKAGFLMDCANPSQGESGVALACTRYRQHRVRKGDREITVSTLDCQGIGTVTEPEVFLSMLLRGLGPAKSFGCGLVLIKPV